MYSKNIKRNGVHLPVFVSTGYRKSAWSSLQLAISMGEGKDNTETLTQNLDKRLKGKKEKKEKDLQLNNLPV